jgi:hypothetical protein
MFFQHNSFRHIAIALAQTVAFLLLSSLCKSQMITGFWKGRINKQKVEVKLIQNGDSLTGTSYYFESPNNYRRYSIKGFFNEKTNEAVWWDDQLLEEKTGRFSLSAPGKNAMLSSADFNCPGGGKMMLDGKTGKKEGEVQSGDVHLDKVNDPSFEDEWDFVIDNFTIGANDPYIIDSIGAIAFAKPVEQPVVISTPVQPPPVEIPVAIKPAPEQKRVDVPVVKKNPPKEEQKPVINPVIPIPPPTIEEKFVTRKKILTTEIPVSGDSVILSFYDNAEIDGDSISLFLNDKLIFSHIRLTGSAYTIRLAVAELQESNELIMVAENLGSIPPNTSYMIAMVGDKRFDARLESTEGSSAMIRFVKTTPAATKTD